MGKRTYNIRWRENDEKELDRLIKNYNQQLYRVGKKYEQDKSVMPDRVRKTELKKQIKTRDDFNKLKKSLSSIDNAVIHTNRGGYMSVGEYKKWQKMGEKVEKIKAKERERIEKLPTFRAGQPIGQKKAQMHSIKENSLKPSTYTIKNKTAKEIEKSFEALDKYFNKRKLNEAQKRYRENYITALKNNGVYTEKIERLVMSLPLQVFVDTAETDEQANIRYAYTYAEAEQVKEEITNAWNGAVARYNAKKGK